MSHGNTPMPFSGDQTPASTGSGELVPFITPGGNPVRVIVIDGEPEFVAADACRILEHSNPSAAVAGLDDDERGLRIVETPSGAQRMVTVTEAGLYSLIIRSRKPEAKAFRRWITHEVLPAIRKTGGYGHAPALEGPELLAHAVLEAQKMIAAKDERIAELEPKAALADTYLTAQGGARLVGEAAKLLGLKERDLRRWLLEEKLVFTKHAPCGAIQYDHYAQFSHHFQATEHVVNHTWGSCTHYTLRILPRGMELIGKRRAATAEAVLNGGAA